tara:strand:- start:254 stop:688 length:435 start_codon:yes stop_codon:yes gene_type:complete
MSEMMSFDEAKQLIIDSFEGIDDWLYSRKCQLANPVLAGKTGNVLVFGTAKSKWISRCQIGFSEDAEPQPHVWTVNEAGEIQDALEDYWYEHTKPTDPTTLISILKHFFGKNQPLNTAEVFHYLENSKEGGNPVLEWSVKRKRH